MNEYLRMKELIVATSQNLVRSGLLVATGGNVSTRSEDGLAFAITPSNFDYMKMSAGDVCILDLDMCKIEGEWKPSVESGMHAAIYKVRPDVHAIVHTHQIYTSTLAIVNKSIPSLFDEQVRFLGKEVKVIPYAPSGTSMLRDTIARHVQDHNNAYMMRNHGALVFGTDMERAVLNAQLLEKCALTYLLALNTEQKISRIPTLVREIAFQKLRSDQKKFNGSKG